MILVKLNIWLLKYFAFGKEEKVFTFKENASMDGKQKIMLVPFYDEMEEEEHWRIYEVSKSCKILLVAALYVMVRCSTVHNFVYKNVKTSFILATSLLKKYVYWVICFILITRTPKHRNRGKQKPKKSLFSILGKRQT